MGNSDRRFWKLEGCGNSFVVVVSRTMPGFWREHVQQVCDPHYGVGSDGILLVTPSEDRRVFNVTMFNPDGSPMGMCGNGVRCIVRALVLEGQVDEEENTTVTLAVGDRRVVCTSYDLGRTVTVNMGRPSFEPEDLPMVGERPAIDEEIEIGGRGWRYTALSLGNPHCVIFLSNLDEVDLHTFGPEVERHPRFPERVNLELARVRSRTSIEVQVWERGAGATLACGTGACAVAVAANLLKLCESRVEVVLPGGALDIEWRGGESDVLLTGPAHEVFRGEWLRDRGVPDL